MKSGKSKSVENSNGIRRGGNQPKAPRSLRVLGKLLMTDCTDLQLKKAKIDK